jgi:pyridoxamine 5'-phosphate oxidase
MIHLKDILHRFDDALQRARDSGVVEPTAMSLATVDATGRPSLRVVLLKHADEHGLVFYTNLQSRKGHELAGNPWAALCFWWGGLGEQIRIEGRTRAVPEAEADAYFASRDRGSQIGAWASHQTSPLPSRDALLERVAETRRRFEGREIPRPPHWSGYRLIPDRFEFWYARDDRLHERLEYRFEDTRWEMRILSP